MRFNFNKFSNREQILLLGLIILIFISALIFVISWLNTKNQSLEKENQNIVSRLNYIESIPSSVSSNRNLYSDNISILVNSTSKEKNIQIPTYLNMLVTGIAHYIIGDLVKYVFK